MKIINGPVLCPHCGSLSAYCVIDRLSKIRTDKNNGEWGRILMASKRKAFCLMCHKTIDVN